MSTLPKDPVMLLSFTNMKLRDECPDLTVFCERYEISCKELCERVLQELIITIRNRVTSLNNYFTKSGIFASR